MRIFFPIGSYYPAKIGGPARVMYDFINKLKSAGIKTIVATTTIGIENGIITPNKIYKEKESELIYFEKINFSTIRYLYSSIKISDVIHLTSLFDIMSIISIIITIFLFPNKMVVWSPRGELSKQALNYKSIKKSFFLKVYSILIKRLNNLWFHSTSSMESTDINRQFKNIKIKLLPNLFLFPNDNIVAEKKKQLLYVGRIHPIKSLDILISSLSESKYFKENGYKLLIAGYYNKEQEEYFKSLNDLLKKLELINHVQFLGHISGEEKRKLYRESELTFLISKSENFGNVVVESLFEGTPVLTSTGTPWDILKENNCGYWTEATTGNIAEKIDSFLVLQETEKLILYKNATRFAIENFDLNNNINKWITFYNNK